MKNDTIKILVTGLFLFFGLGVFSQTTTGTTVTGNLELCEGSVLPVRLDEVVGLGLSAGGGSWNEVNPTDGSVIAENVSNIFLAIDRLPGTYQFMFVPSNNPCLTDEDRALATVEILEIPKPISGFVNFCEGQPISFDLSSLISPSLLTNYTIVYKDAEGNTLTSSTVDINSSGEYIYSYEAQGITTCENTAMLVINATSDDIISTITFDEQMSYCLSAVPELLNLNEDLGLTGGSGTWTAGAGAPPITNGIVDLRGAVIGDYIYTYNWTDCNNGAQNRTFTIRITDDLTTAFVDGSRDVCKTVYGSSIIYLEDILGVDLPANSGVWSEVQATSPVDVMDGIFEMTDSRSGTYVYTYTIGNAVDLCGLSGQSATVTLNVYDASEVLDGEVQLCKANLTAGSMLDLSEYMENLPEGGTWYDASDAALSGTMISTENLELGVYNYKYIFAAGPCGNGTADIFVVVTDMITNFKDKAKSYCLSDDGADQIDLDQVLGIGNVSGTWTNVNGAVNFDATTNVFDGRSEGLGTYTFTFTASETACGINTGDEVTVTISITNDLTQ